MDGLREGLKEAGLTDRDVSLAAVMARGDEEESRTLVAKAVRENPSALVCVGVTPTVQAVTATDLVPVVFLNVFDPVKAKVIGDWTSSGNNAVGVSSHVPVQRRMEYALSLFPAARRWAVISSNDPEARQQAAEVAALAPDFGLEVSVSQGNTPAELERLVRQLVRETDLVFTVEDGLAEAAMAQLAAAAAEASKPVIGASAAALEAGAVAGLAVDYRLVGRQGGLLLAQLIGGAATAGLSSETPAKVEFIINLKAARALGLRLPLELLSVADRVLE
jgi:putative ABC transport system substrate-binding protein